MKISEKRVIENLIKETLSYRDDLEKQGLIPHSAIKQLIKTAELAQLYVENNEYLEAQVVVRLAIDALERSVVTEYH